MQTLQKKEPEVVPCSCLEVPTDYDDVRLVAWEHLLGRPNVAAGAGTVAVAVPVEEIGRHLHEGTCLPRSLVVEVPAGVGNSQ